MSVLQNERVTARPDGKGFTVARDGGVVEVLYTEAFNWVICEGPGLDFVPTSAGGFAIKFPTAEAAVEAALGVEVSA